MRLARFNLTKYSSDQEWKLNYFEGIPSPIGAILILMPLINELSEFRNILDLEFITPILTIVISLLLISKIPTYSFKKIKIKPSLTIFILLIAGISLVSVMFFTFESLFLFGLFYLISLPISFYTFKKKKVFNMKLKTSTKMFSDEK